MLFAQLQVATNCLLQIDDETAIYAALNNIHTICSEISAVRGNVLEKQHDQDTFLDGGVAISPHLAARCLFDPIRTVQFLRGIHAGIFEAMRRFPDEQIHIIYAGCGPYATLLLPLTTQFTSEQIQLTLIDIHQPSIDGVQRLIEALGISDYIYACIQADAITCLCPPGIPIHMVVSETMQAGLAREPQFAIMRNFLSQMEENAIFIPENIVIEACLSRSEQEDIGLLMHRDDVGYPVGRRKQALIERVPIGRIISLNVKTAREEIIGSEWDTISLVTVEIPRRSKQFDQFLVLTSVTVFGSYGFGPYECELSFPLRLHDLNEIASGQKIHFSYVFSRKPGLQHEILPL